MVLYGQRQRPTNPIFNSLIDGITRDNIQRRYEDGTHALFMEYLDQLEGLTYNAIEHIIDNDQELIQRVIHDFIGFEDAHYDDPTEPLNVNVGEYLYDLLGDDDTQNPLYHVCPNIIDTTINEFIQTTQSVILDRRTPYTDTHKTSILLDYIASIMYWYGTAWLLEWSNNELEQRHLQNNTDNTDDETIEILEDD
jgi:hypothetical protein